MIKTPRKLPRTDPRPAHEAGPTDDHSRDRRKFEPYSRVGIRRLQIARVQSPCQTGKRSAERKGPELQTARINPDQLHRRLVGSECHQVTAKHGSLQ